MKLVVWLLVWALCAAAAPPPAKKKPAAVKAKPAPPPVNGLTPALIADGWVLLFDGATTKGWTGAWTVEDGALTGKGKLRTAFPLSDYRLHLEVRASADAAGAVTLRAGAPGGGYRIELAKLEPGKWHELILYARGNQTVARLGGKVIHRDRDIRYTVGAIEFEQTAGKLELRSLRLRPLDMACLFDGKSLQFWDTLASPAWVLRDGLLTSGGTAPLQTNRAWDDYLLQYDFKPAGGEWRTDTRLVVGLQSHGWTNGELAGATALTGPVRGRPVTLAGQPGAAYRSICIAALPR